MSDTADRTFFASRLLHATPTAVFQAFENPQTLGRWWGPEGFTTTFHEFDFREGGQWRFDMHGPDGKDYPNHCQFEEISPQRITIRHLGTVHAFTLVVRIEPAGSGTRVGWNQT